MALFTDMPHPRPWLLRRAAESRPAGSESTDDSTPTPCAQTRPSDGSESSLTTPTVSRFFSSVLCSLRPHPCIGTGVPCSSADGSPSITLHSRSPDSLGPCSFINSVLPTNHLFDHCGP